jgi:hypothetical protein
MILQIQNIHSDQPRISSNQLGEYIYSSPKGKLRILRNQKFGNVFCAPYYGSALRGILKSFKEGEFSQDILLDQMRCLSETEIKSLHHLRRLENNIDALKSFADLGGIVNAPEGTHRVITRNALVPIDGVVISARPEIITESKKEGYSAFTKLRISKSKVSADAQEIVLLVLLHYGLQQSHDGLAFSMEKTRLIDCISKSVISGHTIGRQRDQQLHQALAEIRLIWPAIVPADK